MTPSANPARSRTRWPRLLTGGAAFLLAAEWLAAGPEAPLTRVADIRLLPREKASEAVPIKVRGVVTWRASRDNLTLQDETAGIWVDLVEARNRKLWKSGWAVVDRLREGVEVEITGQSHPGGYAPQILPETLRILGPKPLPKARRVVPARFFSGADDCQRVEARGVVQGVYPTGETVTLLMDANPGRFTAHLSKDVVENPATLVDAEVCVRGVAATHFNTRGEATGVRVMTGAAGDLSVERPPPPPEAVPWVTLDRLLPFRADPLGPHRVRVEGTVTYALPGRYFYLQDGIAAVRVESPSDAALKPGDRVEAAGFVEISRLIGTLCDATVRKTGVAVPPAPVSISPAEILAINETAVKSARVADPHDFDGHLIRCRARLLAVRSDPHGGGPGTLTLEQAAGGGQPKLIFAARLQDDKSGALDALLPGSDLEVTGLVQLDYATNDATTPRISRTVPAGLDLILRGPDDVRVLGKPSWWTARHLAMVLAAVLLALGGALVWSLQLKRQVRRKTRQLAREVNARHDAAIEFQATLRERTRLAANLHDTLLQTMSGLGFQIEACESEVATSQPDGRPPGHLKVAKRMVSHAVDELRNSVWALRSLPLDGMELPEALDAIARRLGAGREARIEVRCGGDLSRVPDFVAGNLLLVVQEAVHNALKHGNPRSVIIEIGIMENPDRIALTISDDGAGFVPGEQLGVLDGHFGLQGMRERLERLDGTLRIRSAPGKGTVIHAEAPLRAYDDEFSERSVNPPPKPAKASPP